jgi:deoxyhypusine synthase
MISSGLRGVFRYLVEHKHVSAIVTTAGGIEEDFIKCLGDTYMSSFSAAGAELRAKGLNRIGNLVVPNSNYCAFEDWVVPILDRMLEEQEASRGTDDEIHWTPSKVIHRLGKEINDERSVYYWAYKNNIPVFCPALTDGSLGDMLYFHTFKSSPQQLRIDIVEDIRKINTIAVRAKRAGMIILGGGVIKHHIANACLMRNGAESAVYINTAQEFDGSDAGARPDEAVSWGKIKIGADAVKVSEAVRSLAGGSVTDYFPGLCRGDDLLSVYCSQHVCKRRPINPHALPTGPVRCTETRVLILRTARRLTPLITPPRPRPSSSPPTPPCPRYSHSPCQSPS